MCSAAKQHLDGSNLFGRNVTAARISGALESLAEAGLAHFRKESVEHSKKPIERWFTTGRLTPALYELHEFNEVDGERG